MSKPAEAPSVHVPYGQSLSPEQNQQLVQKVQEWLNAKSITKCVLCGQGDYDAENFRLVFVLGATAGARIGREQQGVFGSGSSDMFARIGALQSALRRLRQQLQGLRYPAQHHQALELACENCGHIILLDGKKVGATAAFIDPLTGSS